MSVIERLDLTPLGVRNNSTSKQDVSPATLLALMFYGYTSGIYSSRDLALATHHENPYRLITAGTRYNHGIISSFRDHFRNEIESLFVEIMEAVGSLGLARQKHKEHHNSSEKNKLHNEITELLELAEQADLKEAADEAALDLLYFRQPPRSTGDAVSPGANARTPAANDNIDNQPPASQPNGNRTRRGRTPQSAPATGSTTHAIPVRTDSASTTSAGDSKTLKGNKSRRSSTFTFLSRNEAVPSLAAGATTKGAHPWQAARRAGIIFTRVVVSLSRLFPRQARPGWKMGAALVALIPVLVITFLLTSNAWRDTPIVDNPAAEVRHLPDPAYPLPARKTDQSTYALLTPADEKPGLAGRHREGALVSTQIPNQAGSKINPGLAAMLGSKPALAAPVKTAVPASAVAVDPAAAIEMVTEVDPAVAVDPLAGVDPELAAKDTPPIGPDTRDAATAFPKGKGQSVLIYREDWLLDQPSGHYMLQLAGTRNESSLRKLIAKQHPGDPIAYYHGSHKGGDWFILLYGRFSTRQAALDAIGSLPEKLQRNHPWPRTIASIQAALLKERN
jgi:septal ring-binding cell division protein DamX/transposase